MGRMHSKGKAYVELGAPLQAHASVVAQGLAEDVEEPHLQIGVILRDSHGIAQVKSVTGSKVLRILKKNGTLSGLAPEIPEDLYQLIKKAWLVRKHLERNRQDKDSKFRLILIESRIHRLARYYRTNRKLAPNWKYESATASALVA
ncbi:hypothetical protein PINS_up022854 [Pythium insidiosum]|nr:hypothetical protein PINS_up022854 [Pythium insidiosum]